MDAVLGPKPPHLRIQITAPLSAATASGYSMSRASHLHAILCSPDEPGEPQIPNVGAAPVHCTSLCRSRLQSCSGEALDELGASLSQHGAPPKQPRGNASAVWEGRGWHTVGGRSRSPHHGVPRAHEHGHTNSSGTRRWCHLWSLHPGSVLSWGHCSTGSGWPSSAPCLSFPPESAVTLRFSVTRVCQQHCTAQPSLGTSGAQMLRTRHL